MSRLAVRLVCLSVLTLSIACASSPEPEPEDEEPSAAVHEAPEKPEPPEYHRASDVEQLDAGVARSVAGEICGNGVDPNACRQRLTQGV